MMSKDGEHDGGYSCQGTLVSAVLKIIDESLMLSSLTKKAEIRLGYIPDDPSLSFVYLCAS